MRPMRYRLLATWIAPVFLLAPTALQACPQCFASADNQVLHAYYVSALFLVLVPFGIVGSILAWLFIQKRRTDGVEVLQDAAPSEAEANFSQEVPT